MAGREEGSSTKPATISVEEAARRLGIGRNQGYEAAHKGQIPTIRIGKRLLVPVESLSRMLGISAE